MAKTITLPERLVKKEELVVIPRIEYEQLLRIAKKQKELDEELAKSIKDVRQKKVFGPFNSAKDLVKSLSS